MFTLDLMIKDSPMPISVQKNEEQEAQALYQKILTLMTATTPEVIELTCDKQEDKKIALLSDKITGVIISKKSGSASSGKAPGFFAAVADNN